MDAEQILLVELRAASVRGEADNMRAALPALLELSGMVAMLTAVRFVTLRKGGLSVEEAVLLCKG